ncbi:hypothetical protein LCGC14_3093320, partial [marine sediment metagenome]
ILNYYKNSKFFLEFWKLRQIIKKEKPDILHCFLPHANIIGRFAAIGSSCKVICSIRAKQCEKKYFLPFDRFTQKLVNIYTVNSKSLAQFEIVQKIDKNKIVLIENGIDFEIFKITNNPNNLRNELNLQNLIIISMVAHLRKQKDYPTALRAIKHLQKEFNICFLIIGTGNPFENEIYKIYNLIDELELSNVKLLGFRNDIPNLLAITDVWISSTLYEGQSNSLLEAMAMGIPIVTTDISENAEVVRDGKEALLVPIKSPLLMSKAIKRLITNKKLAKTISKNAYDRVYAKYHINKTLEKLEHLYSSLLT